MKKVFFAFLIFSAFFSLGTFAQAPQAKPSSAKYSVSQEDAFLQGCEAFRNEDWISAMFFLKRAVTSKKYSTDEVHYMLIASEMSAGEYKMAEGDCANFLASFPKSAYAPFVQYQRGRALHYIGNNEQSILILSDFCHENVDSNLYPSALYWIAENFYAQYNYDSARALYERIVTEFPNDEKAADARRRLDSINQRNREEKLLYLLKVTGEEYLAAKEDYERQLKLYKTEDSMGLRKQLAAAQDRISELQKKLERQEYLNASNSAGTPEVVYEENATIPLAQTDAAELFPDPSSSYENSTSNNGYLSEDPDVEALKRKARHLENYMGNRNESNLDAALREDVYGTNPAQQR